MCSWETIDHEFLNALQTAPMRPNPHYINDVLSQHYLTVLLLDFIQGHMMLDCSLNLTQKELKVFYSYVAPK